MHARFAVAFVALLCSAPFAGCGSGEVDLDFAAYAGDSSSIRQISMEASPNPATAGGATLTLRLAGFPPGKKIRISAAEPACCLDLNAVANSSGEVAFTRTTGAAGTYRYAVYQGPTYLGALTVPVLGATDAGTPGPDAASPGPDAAIASPGLDAGQPAQDAGSASACVPDCAGRACGSDGCGGTCGACSSTQSCDGLGRCGAVPVAAGAGTNAGSGYTGAADGYADEVDMRFRKGLSSFDSTALVAVPTFQSVGLYWPRLSTVIAGSEVSVKYRRIGQPGWKSGAPLWFDARNAEYRGSVVGLEAGASYEFQAVAASGASAAVVASTWSETFPIARTITVAAGTTSQTLTVDQSGSPAGYVLYTAAPAGSTIDQGFAQTGTQNCVDVKASYVVIRGLTLKNCQANGIALLSGAHDVVIEGNDISGFGSGPGGAVQGATGKIVPGNYWQGGVYCNGERLATAQKPYRVVVQRNRIHEPRYGSIHWGYGHPNSANGILSSHCGTNNVYRYNEIGSVAGHYFGDGIGGGDNFSFEGFPAADTDIHGNKISECYDDAIESEGGNRNVRIFGNYLHHSMVGIALATTSVGPFYAFRNVFNENAGMTNPQGATDSEDRGPFFKMGSRDAAVNGGRIYVLHNTSIQPAIPTGASASYPFGAGGGLVHAGGTAINVVSRNNILSNFKDWHETIAVDAGDVDYDLYTGALTLSGEAHGFVGSPVFATSVDPALAAQTYPDVGGTYKALVAWLPTRDPSAAGDFTLAATSKGFGAGQPLPGFNDEAARPDVGAHQSGTAAMEFGVGAYLGSAR